MAHWHWHIEWHSVINQFFLPLYVFIWFSNESIDASASADIASNKDDNTKSDTNNTSTSNSNGGINAEIEKFILFTLPSLLTPDGSCGNNGLAQAEVLNWSLDRSISWHHSMVTAFLTRLIFAGLCLSSVVRGWRLAFSCKLASQRESWLYSWLYCQNHDASNYLRTWVLRHLRPTRPWSYIPRTVWYSRKRGYPRHSLMWRFVVMHSPGVWTNPDQTQTLSSQNFPSTLDATSNKVNHYIK